MTFKLSNNRYYTPQALAKLANSTSEYAVEALLTLEKYMSESGKHHQRLLRRVEQYRMANPSSEEDIQLEQQHDVQHQEQSARKWCRNLIERYAQGDESVIELITETPYGRILLSLFEAAAQGSTKASDQVFKLIGAYAPVQSEDTLSINKPQLFEI